MSSAQTIAFVECSCVSFVVELLDLGIPACSEVPSCECSEALDIVRCLRELAPRLCV